MIFVFLVFGIYILVPKPHSFLCLGLWKLRTERESHKKKKEENEILVDQILAKLKRLILFSMNSS